MMDGLSAYTVAHRSRKVNGVSGVELAGDGRNCSIFVVSDLHAREEGDKVKVKVKKMRNDIISAISS